MTARFLPALDRFDRFPLLDGPTPIERLHRLEQTLGDAAGGVRLFVKRDDLMGLGGGGNKLRKLEFLIGEARARQCDTFITTGGLQSNHARLSAAAAARAGLACELVLTRMVAREDEAYRKNGNVLLDGLLGATIHELPGDANAMAFAEERAAALKKEGRRPYVVGLGGSTPIGALGYAMCAREIAEQEAGPGEFARIVLPNGSSGTHAGLAAGLAAMQRNPARLRSFAVLIPADRTRPATLELSRDAPPARRNRIDRRRGDRRRRRPARRRLRHSDRGDVRRGAPDGAHGGTAARSGVWGQGVRGTACGHSAWRVAGGRRGTLPHDGWRAGALRLPVRVRGGEPPIEIRRTLASVGSSATNLETRCTTHL